MKRALVATIAMMFVGATSLLGDAKLGWTKVLLHHRPGNAPIADTALAQMGAERINQFDAYTLVRVPLNRLEGIAAFAKATGVPAERVDEWDFIKMPNFTVDARDPKLPATGLLADYPSGKGLYVIQFAAPRDAAMLAAFPSGLKYLAYLPYNAALVYGPAASVQSLKSDPSIQWTSIYHAAFRAQPSEFRNGPQDYTVQLVDVPEAAAMVSQLQAKSPPGAKVIRAMSSVIVDSTLTPAEARTLLQGSYVIAVQRKGINLVSGEREALALTTTGPTPPAATGDTYRNYLASKGLLNLNPSDYRIAIADFGLAGGPTGGSHPDLPHSRVQAWVSYVPNEGPFDSDGHGTAVAGVAAGDPTGGLDSQNYWYGVGVAPKAGLIIQRILKDGNPPYGDASNWMDFANQHNAGVMTLSRNTYIDGAVGAYTLEDSNYDDYIRAKNLAVTVSVGNTYPPGQFFDDLRVLSPAVAKNVISVGGTESVRPGSFSCPPLANTPAQWTNAAWYNDVAYMSRRGVQDGRIKPDVVFPSTLISTAYWNTGRSWCSITGNHLISSGTSFASPQAAGTITLLNKRQNRPGSARMGPALAKAALIGNAFSLKGNLDGYSQSLIGARPETTTGQGWGRVVLNELLDEGLQELYLEGTESTTGFLAPFTGSGQLRQSAWYTVAASYKPVTIVLAWTDEPGATNANPALVNDLDLKISPNVCVPNGYGQYRALGNYFDASNEDSWNVCGFDTFIPIEKINNVEVVRIPAGAITSFRIDVVAKSIGGFVPPRNKQPFSVYVKNGRL